MKSKEEQAARRKNRPITGKVGKVDVGIKSGVSVAAKQSTTGATDALGAEVDKHPAPEVSVVSSSSSSFKSTTISLSTPELSPRSSMSVSVSTTGAGAHDSLSINTTSDWQPVAPLDTQTLASLRRFSDSGNAEADDASEYGASESVVGTSHGSVAQREPSLTEPLLNFKQTNAKPPPPPVATKKPPPPIHMLQGIANKSSEGRPALPSSTARLSVSSSSKQVHDVSDVYDDSAAMEDDHVSFEQVAKETLAGDDSYEEEAEEVVQVADVSLAVEHPETDDVLLQSKDTPERAQQASTNLEKEDDSGVDSLEKSLSSARDDSLGSSHESIPRGETVDREEPMDSAVLPSLVSGDASAGPASEAPPSGVPSSPPNRSPHSQLTLAAEAASEIAQARSPLSIRSPASSHRSTINSLSLDFDLDPSPMARDQDEDVVVEDEDVEPRQSPKERPTLSTEETARDEPDREQPSASLSSIPSGETGGAARVLPQEQVLDMGEKEGERVAMVAESTETGSGKEIPNVVESEEEEDSMEEVCEADEAYTEGDENEGDVMEESYVIDYMAGNSKDTDLTHSDEEDEGGEGDDDDGDDDDGDDIQQLQREREAQTVEQWCTSPTTGDTSAACMEGTICFS